MSWTERPLGEVATLQRGFDLPSQDRRPGSVPIVSSSGPSDVHAVARVAAPGVVTGRYGTIGQVFYVTTPFWPLNTTLWVKDFHGNDPRFVYYLLHTVDFESCNDKSGVPGVNRNDLHRLLIDMPKTLDEQRAIAEVLGALDDKVELNRQMNHTLEEMASALFKSWFVDFDPVVAKAEGRKPFGMDAATAALFPAAMEGEVPRGWRAGTLGDVASNVRRGVEPGAIQPDTPYIGLEHMPRRSIALDAWGSAEEVGSNKFRFNRGDLLFGKLRPYFHKVGLAPVDGVCSTDILVIQAKVPEMFGFIVGHCSSEAFVLFTDAGSDGTKMPRTSWHLMAAYELAIPTRSVADRYLAIVKPYLSLIEANTHESRTLAALRDALLPKLLSGEVRLKQAEKAVEAAL